MPAIECLKHKWMDLETHKETVVISTDKLKKFIIRRKWQVKLQFYHLHVCFYDSFLRVVCVCMYRLLFLNLENR